MIQDSSLVEHNITVYVPSRPRDGQQFDSETHTSTRAVTRWRGVIERVHCQLKNFAYLSSRVRAIDVITPAAFLLLLLLVLRSLMYIIFQHERVWLAWRVAALLWNMSHVPLTYEWSDDEFQPHSGSSGGSGGSDGSDGD